MQRGCRASREPGRAVGAADAAGIPGSHPISSPVRPVTPSGRPVFSDSGEMAHLGLWSLGLCILGKCGYSGVSSDAQWRCSLWWEGPEGWPGCSGGNSTRLSGAGRGGEVSSGSQEVGGLARVKRRCVPGGGAWPCPRQKQRSRGNSGCLRCAELSENEKGLLQLRNPRVWRGCRGPAQGPVETRLALDCVPSEKHLSRPFPGQPGCLLTAPHRLSPLCRLKQSRLKVRFCTNESQKSRVDLVGLLRRLGFDVSEGEVTAPAPAACLILKQRGLRPHLLVHDGRPPGPWRRGEGTPFPAGGWGGHRGSTWPLLDPWALGWNPGAPCWDPGPIHPGIIPGLGVGVGWGGGQRQGPYGSLEAGKP